MSKYGHRQGNWLEAIVNKLGGEEAADKFLRNELMVVPATSDPWQTTVSMWKQQYGGVIECTEKAALISLYDCEGRGEPILVRPLLIGLRPDLTFHEVMYIGTDNSVRTAAFHDGKWLDYPN